MSQNPEFEVALGSRALRASSETSVSFRDNAQAYEAGYAKALDDYAVVDLLRKLSDFDAIDEGGRSIAPSWEEASVLAALLIGQLSDRIDSMLISSYFKAMRQGQTDAFPVSPLEYPQSTELPVGFDNGSETGIPRYREGTKIRLTPIDGISEWGTIIGRYFAYAHIVGCGCGATYSGWSGIQRVPLGSKLLWLGKRKLKQ
jgi:hypothetical protein